VCETQAFRIEFPIQVVIQAMRYFPYTNQQGGLIRRLWKRFLGIAIAAAFVLLFRFVHTGAYLRRVLYFRGSFSKIYGL
jgi:hypothetical protein